MQDACVAKGDTLLPASAKGPAAVVAVELGALALGPKGELAVLAMLPVLPVLSPKGEAVGFDGAPEPLPKGDAVGCDPKGDLAVLPAFPALPAFPSLLPDVWTSNEAFVLKVYRKYAVYVIRTLQ